MTQGVVVAEDVRASMQHFSLRSLHQKEELRASHNDGLCLMTLNSYIKNGKDPVVDYLKSFARLKN